MIEFINFQNTQAYIKSCQTSGKVYSYTECENRRTKEFLLIQKHREWKMTVTAPKMPPRSPQPMHLVFPVSEQRRTKVSANKEQKLLVGLGSSPGTHLLTRFFSILCSFDLSQVYLGSNLWVRMSYLWDLTDVTLADEDICSMPADMMSIGQS